MVQGALKKSKPAAAKVTHSKRQASKVHKSTSNKKSSAAIEKTHRKFLSGMAAKTEALLGERAGHLELIGKGKKGKDKRATVKGGSKKFG
ncbi:Protein of unknown function (DUF2462) [Geosmithia morbida]|uniref:Uncharacterized protein n=1 Tax=Geosmithia morbida TaxID=1094350 RepID=A0A9P5D7G4_9HYPO|nr:Protein of unknown function (DUF2462) [Geosmithia morbida]KAF4125765.1 Protein of unknown function (DUF2462) [Geosmithia morbida]